MRRRRGHCLEDPACIELSPWIPLSAVSEPAACSAVHCAARGGVQGSAQGTAAAARPSAGRAATRWHPESAPRRARWGLAAASSAAGEALQPPARGWRHVSKVGVGVVTDFPVESKVFRLRCSGLERRRLVCTSGCVHQCMHGYARVGGGAWGYRLPSHARGHDAQTIICEHLPDHLPLERQQACHRCFVLFHGHLHLKRCNAGEKSSEKMWRFLFCKRVIIGPKNASSTVACGTCPSEKLSTCTGVQLRLAAAKHLHSDW